MTLTYASTVALPDAWYEELASRLADVEVLRPGGAPDDWPADVRDRVTVLHTTDAGFDPDRFPSLGLVQLDTPGVDHIAGTPLWASDIPLVTLGGIAPVPMAEHAVLCLLGLAHHLPSILADREAHRWRPAAERLVRYTPRSLPGATVCIVGFGRIGREIGRLCSALGMRVVGVRRTAAVDGGARFDRGRSVGAGDAEVVPLEGLDDALGRADVVILVLPLTESTRGLFDAGRLDAMRPGASLIDVGRGGVVVGEALLERLRSGRIAAAALDVFEQEPLPPDSPWWTEPNVLMTPHVAGLAPDYLGDTLDLVAENLHRLQTGQALMNEVDRARGY